MDAVTFLPVARTRIIPVNANTASEVTLYGMLGIGQGGLLARILQSRALRPLRAIDAAELAVDPGLVQSLAPLLTVRSTYFRIGASAERGGHAAQIEALVQRDAENGVTVLQWLY
jgi:type II secretory pathway component PulK